MIDKIYVVLLGHWEADALAYFSTHELAEKYMESLNKNTELTKDLSIETIKLDPYKNALQAGLKPFFIRMDKAGNVLEFEHSDSFADDLYGKIRFDKEENLVLEILALNKEEVVTQANATRLKYIEENNWGKDD